MECLKRWENGDWLERQRLDVVLHFAGERHTLGTSRLNGGYQKNLQAVFNHCDTDPTVDACVMRAETYREHLALAASAAGLLPECSTGLSTAVDMKYVLTAERSWKNFMVTAVVTGGILHNGRRAGDAATMWEEGEVFHCVEGQDGALTDQATGGHRVVPYHPGTINILLHINANLDPNAMAAAIMVATEAKAAAIQEVGLNSCYSQGMATGSGTDGIIVVSDFTSPVWLTQAGTDTKLGECIAQAVKEGVKRSLLWNIEVEREKENLRRGIK